MNKMFFYTAMLFMALYSGQAFAQQKSTEVEKMATRFIEYANIGSQAVDTTPGLFYVTPQQKNMAWKVYNDIRAIKGVEFVRIDTNFFFVYAKVGGTRKGKGSPSICFASHLDITPEVEPGPNSGIPVRPQIHRNYDGNAIVLEDGVVLSPDSPEGKYLKDCIGKTLVSSDGRTLLGGDNKAGVSICVSIIERLVKDRSPRGDVYFIFSMNEEVGMSAQGLRLEWLDELPSVFVDLDGADPNELSVESFTGEQRKYSFTGNWVHTSNAGNFGDATAAMMMFGSLIPLDVHPSRSTGKQGYVHCYSAEEVNGHDWALSYRVRYFSKADSLVFDKYFSEAMRRTQEEFPLVLINLDTSYIAYDNIANHMYPGTVECIMRAAEHLGIPMRCTSLRAGTTSALMSAIGLPSGPCMFSGVYNEHTKLEYVCIDQLVEIADLCQEIIREVAKLKK